MISRMSLSRNAQRAVWRRQCQCQCISQPNNRRGLAAAASGSFTYETGEATGVKYGSRDLPGPTTHIAVVARAGTRYQPAPGFTDGLEKFAFKVRVKDTCHSSRAESQDRNATRLGSPADISNHSEHIQTICLENHQRSRVARRRAQCMALEGESHYRCEVLTR